VLLPFTFAQSFDGYEAAFAAQTALLALGSVALVWRLLPAVLPETGTRERRWRTAACIVAFPLLGQLVTTRLDLAPTALVALALYLWLRGREGWGWAALAAGTALKLFPIVLAPLLALDVWRRRGFAPAARGGLAFAGLTALCFVPALLVSPSGLWHAFTYHGERGVQIESIYASLVLSLYHLTGLPVGVDNVFGAFEAISAWTDELKVVATAAQVMGLAVVYGVWWRTGAALLPAATLTLGVFILAGKVFSPQYLIWLIPLVVLTPGRAGRWAIGLFLATLALTQALFPYAYERLLAREGWAVVLLNTRNLLFAATLVALAVALARSGARADVVRPAHPQAESLSPSPVAPHRQRA
jgi:uncharacterized membrane protein